MSRTSNGRLARYVSLLLLLLGVSGKSEAQIFSIEEAIDLWTLDGATFESLQSCPIDAKPSSTALTLTLDLNLCTLTDVAAYTLTKECQDRTVSSVMIRNIEKQDVMTFAIDRHTCALLTPTPSHHATPKKPSLPQEIPRSTLYVLQFYAGQTAPTAGIETCGIALPLRVHHINGTYYLFSDVIEHYSEASKLMNELQTRCPELDMWVRPIQR